MIDEYEFVVHPRLAGHGPTLFAGLPGVTALCVRVNGNASWDVVPPFRC